MVELSFNNFGIKKAFVNICRRVVGNILKSISSSIVFLTLLKQAQFHRNCQAVLDAVSTDGLNHIVLKVCNMV